MKRSVLYIGHYKDGTGWGNAAQNNILALHRAGVDVYPRAITYETDGHTCHPEIEELENKDSNDYDFVIQHTLPSNWSYDSRFYNIGCFTTESSDFIPTGWQNSMNMMDEIWVPTQNAMDACLASGVSKPIITVVPYGIEDVAVPANGQTIKELNDNFTFGFVGEFIERKNVKALIKAFHITFQGYEPVNLFIKTSKSDLDSVNQYIQHVKNGMKLGNDYKEVVVVAGIMDKKDYYSVLNQVDCFVMPSRGESPCIPAMEALSLGIPVMRTDGIGMPYTETINEFYPSHVNSYDTPCFGAVDALPDLDTALSTWKEIDVLDLAEKMRFIFDNRDQGNKSLYEAIDSVTQTFTLQYVGENMKEILNARKS